MANDKPTIHRRFVTLGNRQIHLRIAGKGPAVILLGQSPTSGQTLDRQTLAFARHFTAITIDTPGLGRSSPLDTHKPDVADQALALAELMDALGVEKAGLYGSHTGASICLEFARRYPERAVLTLLDGLPIYNDLERNLRLSTYFPEYTATWEGLHLMWLWYRYREQNVFWPWNIRGRGTRGNCDIPSPEHLHRGIVDILQVGMGYVPPYSAVFRYRAEEAIPHLSSSVGFLAYPDDSLLPALRHLPALPDCCRIIEMPDNREEAVEKEVKLFRSCGTWDGLKHTIPAGRVLVGATHDYVDVANGQLALSRYGASSKRPLLILPPVPGSATQLDRFPQHLAVDREVVTLDLPGCGDSDSMPGVVGSIANMANVIAEAISKLFQGAVDIYAKDGGACVAVELSNQRPDLVGRLFLQNAPALGRVNREEIALRYAEKLDITWDGSYLIKLWHATRDQELYWPWYDRTRQAVRDVDFEIEPDQLTVEVLAYLKNAGSYHLSWKAVLSYPLVEALADYKGPLTLLANRNEKFFRQLGDISGHDLRELPDGYLAQAEVVRDLLDE